MTLMQAVARLRSKLALEGDLKTVLDFFETGVEEYGVCYIDKTDETPRPYVHGRDWHPWLYQARDRVKELQRIHAGSDFEFWVVKRVKWVGEVEELTGEER